MWPPHFLEILGAVVLGSFVPAAWAAEAREGAQPIRVEKPEGLEKLPGTWHAAELRVDIIIVKMGAGHVLAARDRKDGEQLQVSELRWDGSILSGKFLTPSTQRLTHLMFSALNETTLVAVVNGDAKMHFLLRRKSD